MDARDLFALTVRLRWRLLDALRSAPENLLEHERDVNHRSIAETLIHIMSVEQSWVHEDLSGGEPVPWQQFRDQYLAGTSAIDAVITGWRKITDDTRRYLAHEYAPAHVITLPGWRGDERRVTVEQILVHLCGEEMIHMGEVLAMTRQAGVDVPDYFLLSVMGAGDKPWETWAAGR